VGALLAAGVVVATRAGDGAAHAARLPARIVTKDCMVVIRLGDTYPADAVRARPIETCTRR
jgi:hypothetical protein